MSEPGLTASAGASIGIVIPNLNGGATLDWTLLGLARQRGGAPSVIVVDSGSSDDSRKVCARWNAPVVYDPPGNMYRSINVGLRKLQTEWYGYINADDIFYPDALQRLADLGDTDGADMVYGHADYIDWEGRYLRTFRAAPPCDLGRLLEYGMMAFAQPAILFRRRAFERLGGYDERFTHVADCDFVRRANHAGLRFARLDFPPVVAFRIHATQRSRRESGLADLEAATMLSGRAISRWRGELAVAKWRLERAGDFLERWLRGAALPGRITGQ